MHSNFWKAYIGQDPKSYFRHAKDLDVPVWCLTLFAWNSRNPQLAFRTHVSLLSYKGLLSKKQQVGSYLDFYRAVVWSQAIGKPTPPVHPTFLCNLRYLLTTLKVLSCCLWTSKVLFNLIELKTISHTSTTNLEIWECFTSLFRHTLPLHGMFPLCILDMTITYTFDISQSHTSPHL